MTDALLQIATVTACAILLYRAEGVLNAMRHGTRWTLRLSIYQLALAAGAEVLAILAFGYVPSGRESALAAAIAGLMLGERHLRLLLPGQKCRMGAEFHSGATIPQECHPGVERRCGGDRRGGCGPDHRKAEP